MKKLYIFGTMFIVIVSLFLIRHPHREQTRSVNVNLSDGTKQVNYLVDTEKSYRPYSGCIDIYKASSSDIESADLAKYEKEFGEVKDESTAIKVASIVITDIKEDCLTIETPFKLKFNKNANAWIIHGTLPSGWAGGVISIAISENGKILMLTHTK
jgi:hypothetical protein